MKWNARQNEVDEELDEMRMDPALKEAIGDFRQSVHAWSEAAMSRPRPAIHPAVHTAWRVAVSWAMGCLLAAGSVGGALYERRHQQEKAQQATAQQARQKELAAEAAAANTGTTKASTREQDEQLLAEVDSDVSREVPSAMEPLAELMDETANQ